MQQTSEIVKCGIVKKYPCFPKYMTKKIKYDRHKKKLRKKKTWTVALVDIVSIKCLAHELSITLIVHILYSEMGPIFKNEMYSKMLQNC